MVYLVVLLGFGDGFYYGFNYIVLGLYCFMGFIIKFEVFFVMYGGGVVII